MPLSSVLGASSVIKPGVCTSTTRPTVPYTGQLIFETDTSRLAVWTGSAWQYETAAAGPPGLVYITGASFTTATSVSLPTNTFSSTYRNYRVFFHLTAVTTTGNITGRLRSAGVDYTTARYFQMSTGINLSGTTSNQADGGTTSWTLGSQGSSAFPMYGLTLDFIAPNISSIAKLASGYLNYYDGTATYIGRAINLIFDTTTGTPFTADSFTIISSAASSMTGIYRVYGYTDS